MTEIAAAKQHIESLSDEDLLREFAQTWTDRAQIAHVLRKVMLDTLEGGDTAVLAIEAIARECGLPTWYAPDRTIAAVVNLRQRADKLAAQLEATPVLTMADRSKLASAQITEDRARDYAKIASERDEAIARLSGAEQQLNEANKRGVRLTQKLGDARGHIAEIERERDALLRAVEHAMACWNGDRLDRVGSTLRQALDMTRAAPVQRDGGKGRDETKPPPGWRVYEENSGTPEAYWEVARADDDAGSTDWEHESMALRDAWEAYDREHGYAPPLPRESAAPGDADIRAAMAELSDFMRRKAQHGLVDASVATAWACLRDALVDMSMAGAPSTEGPREADSIAERQLAVAKGHFCDALDMLVDVLPGDSPALPLVSVVTKTAEAMLDAVAAHRDTRDAQDDRLLAVTAAFNAWGNGEAPYRSSAMQAALNRIGEALGQPFVQFGRDTREAEGPRERVALKKARDALTRAARAMQTLYHPQARQMLHEAAGEAVRAALDADESLRAAAHRDTREAEGPPDGTAPERAPLSKRAQRIDVAGRAWPEEDERVDDENDFAMETQEIQALARAVETVLADGDALAVVLSRAPAARLPDGMPEAEPTCGATLAAARKGQARSRHLRAGADGMPGEPEPLMCPVAKSVCRNAECRKSGCGLSPDQSDEIRCEDCGAVLDDANPAHRIGNFCRGECKGPRAKSAEYNGPIPEPLLAAAPPTVPGEPALEDPPEDYSIIREGEHGWTAWYKTTNLGYCSSRDNALSCCRTDAKMRAAPPTVPGEPACECPFGRVVEGKITAEERATGYHVWHYLANSLARHLIAIVGIDVVKKVHGCGEGHERNAWIDEMGTERMTHVYRNTPWCLSAAPPTVPEEPPTRPHHLKWNGTEWVDERCGCRYHPDDDNGKHGGAPHVHLCEKHSRIGNG